MSGLNRLLAPLERSIGNMIARGVVSVVNAASKMQTLQIRLMAGERKDDIEHFEPYGWTSHAKPGSEPLALFFDGDRSHGVVVCVADRRYRLTGLEQGEVAIHDDQGQKIHLTRNGLVIDGAGLPVRVQNTPSITLVAPTVTVEASTKMRLESAELECTGDVTDRCDDDGTTMEWIRLQIETINTSIALMKSRYNAHKHTEYNVVGKTSAPDLGM